jgi:hypothetical protein
MKDKDISPIIRVEKDKYTGESKEVRYSELSKFIEQNLDYFNGVQRFKSIARAIKRGLVSENGIVAPRRPFNNRKDISRKHNSYNTLRRNIYGELKLRAGF